jgi:glycosyltransferase involved in cell wall biosynthesis
VVLEKSRTFYEALLQYIQDNNLSVKVIFSENLKGISYSRNLGIQNASGSIIAITDDDAILSPVWGENLVETYKRYPEAIGVTGEALPLWINSSDSWFPRSLYWMIGCTAFRGWTSERPTNVTSGVNMSFRSEAFNFATFPTNLGAGASAEGKLSFPNEDNDFALKITSMTRRPIIYNPVLSVHHKVYSYRLHVRYIRKYAFWQGCAESRYSENWYSKGKRQTFRIKLLKDFAIDVISSVSSDKHGIRKTKIFVTLFFFFSLGYIAHKLGLKGI